MVSIKKVLLPFLHLRSFFCCCGFRAAFDREGEMKMGFSGWASLSIIVVLFTAPTFGYREIALHESPKLHDDEVATLKVIASKLKKIDWDFGVDPCSGTKSWVTPAPEFEQIFANNVTCACIDSSPCHIVSIELTGQNLTGILPEEFADLTFLQTLDLSRNYLSGCIPTRWASLPMKELFLLGNRITGTIPKELGQITTLISLDIQDNSLGGVLPPDLGNLTNLHMFLASGNNFIGPLPQSYGLLRNLMDFRIDGSGITGKVPEFIGNWTKLNRLDMQGTSMEGPLPSAISQLNSLIMLRISDLSGSNNSFPFLEKMRYIYQL